MMMMMMMIDTTLILITGINNPSFESLSITFSLLFLFFFSCLVVIILSLYQFKNNILIINQAIGTIHNNICNIINLWSTLPDDNFSIVTASDLYQASPSSIPPHLSPYSTPSPLLSDTYHTAHSDYYSMMDLFGPVEQSTNKKITAATEKKHICPVCSHRSKRRHNLVEHMLTHNPHRPKIFKCSHCSRPFARKYDMKRHEKIHTR
ncbi:hypothetical protein EDC94DRAFT_610387 [Helicostylum pulchrum]|nr:hypothetical protein EDC94DRAFT_610387 [Helicostylum pulchrum]